MKKGLATAFGIPVGEDQKSLTAGERGPVLTQDMHFIEKLIHFDREKIPERVVHAKGKGAIKDNQFCCYLYPPVAKKQYRNRAGVLEKPCSGTFRS